MDEKNKRRLAELALKVGVDIQKDQCLVVWAGVGNYEYAQIIADTAYQLGARFVEIRLMDNELLKSRIRYSSKENLSYVPRSHIDSGHMMIDESWAYIKISNTEESDVLNNVYSDDLSTVEFHRRESLKFLTDKLMRHHFPWLILAVPGPQWAKKVYGLPADASEADVQEALRKLEKIYISILRLNSDDPISTWKELGKKLAERARALDTLQIDSLRFRSPNSDLTVGLSPEHIWCGGPARLPDGRYHEPNLPSEEVFTAPDFRRTEGIIHILRPVMVMETLVEGVWFRFSEGRVVEFGASSGREIIEKFLSLDEGAAFLGEVALVDINSPISRSDLVFSNILFDENASCHIALGAAYPICLSNGSELTTQKALKNAGCNVSVAHTDFMISNDKTDVLAYCRDGREIHIITNGKFVM
ncbi:MAG: aminopeptidase [Salinispira sp.]